MASLNNAEAVKPLLCSVTGASAAPASAAASLQDESVRTQQPKLQKVTRLHIPEDSAHVSLSVGHGGRSA